MIKINYSDILSEKCIKSIQQVINREGVLIYPTDTLYGIGGDFFSLSVMSKIDDFKKRNNVPYSAAISGLKMLKELVTEIPDVFYVLFENVLPGKFTLLFKASSDIHKSLLKSSKKIGIRFPNLPDLLQLIDILAVPLISTSVNQTGQQPMKDPVQMIKQFNKIDLLIDAGVLPESRGSTVLDLTEMPIKCIRTGDDYQKLINLGIEMVIC